MRRLALLIPLVAVCAQPALAARPANTDEVAALLGGAESPVYCFSASVSTVDPSWAAVTPSGDADAACAGNGLDIVHSTGAGWQSVYSGPRDGDGPACADMKVPAAVGVDLGVCRPPVPPSKTTMFCTKRILYTKKKRTPKPRAVVRPRACSTLTSDQSFAEAVDLLRLHWKTWGGKTATASGQARAWHGEVKGHRVWWPRIRVRVVAYSPAEYGGMRWYERVRVTVAGRSSTFKLDPPF